MITKDNKHVCDICKVSVHFFLGGKKINSPMLHTEIWKQCLRYYNIKYSRTNSQFLCEDCMEKALGRPIHISDLRICPLSEDWAKEHYEHL